MTLSCNKKTHNLLQIQIAALNSASRKLIMYHLNEDMVIDDETDLLAGVLADEVDALSCSQRADESSIMNYTTSEITEDHKTNQNELGKDDMALEDENEFDR